MQHYHICFIRISNLKIDWTNYCGIEPPLLPIYRYTGRKFIFRDKLLVGTGLKHKKASPANAELALNHMREQLLVKRVDNHT